MKPIYNILLLLALVAYVPAPAQDDNSGDVKVTVYDESSQPMPGAVVVIVAGGSKAGGQTDMDGNFTFRALPPGTYDIEAKMLNYKNYVKQGVIVNAGQTSYVSYAMELVTDSVVTVYGQVDDSPIDITYSTVQNVNSQQLKTMAVQRGDIAAIVTGTCSSCSVGKGGQLVMRGARETATTTYVDGEKLYGSLGIPGGSIEQVTILSGGIPASFGDMTGGVIIITTKSFYNGMAAKQRMYEQDQELRDAAKQALQQKNGQRKEDGKQIIEQNNGRKTGN